MLPILQCLLRKGIDIEKLNFFNLNSPEYKPKKKIKHFQAGYIIKVKSPFKPNGPSGQSLSRFL